MTSSSCGIAPVLVLFEGADPPFISVSDKSMIVRMKREWFEVDRALGGTTWFPHVFPQQLFPGIPRHQQPECKRPFDGGEAFATPLD